MRGAIPPLPNTPSWSGVQLKHRDNFTFNFTPSKNNLLSMGSGAVPFHSNSHRMLGDFISYTNRVIHLFPPVSV
jgi:hypothetical protein